jgi:hypothetical protein
MHCGRLQSLFLRCIYEMGTISILKGYHLMGLSLGCSKKVKRCILRDRSMVNPFLSTLLNLNKAQQIQKKGS